MTPHRRVAIPEHPLALGSFRSWLRLLRDSGGVDRRYLPRILFVTLSTFLTGGLRLWERTRYGRAVEETAIHPSPIFIVGHWRTGTTYLHNLMVQDDNLGFVSTFQGIAPGFCLVGERWIKPLLALWAHKTHHTRLIDNIPLSFDAPQEEEFALGNLSPHSSLHVYTLPARASHLFERYALFTGLSPQALDAWTEIYLGVLRKATFRAGGKRLILKNPANSGRIPALLALFPEARFIHIYRNPYDVFVSTRWTYRTVLPRSQVQDIGADQVEAYVLGFYARLMSKFLADKALIPAGNLVEVRFEDLEAAPLAQLRRIYEGLRLPGYAAAEPAFRAHVAATADYQKNRYHLTDEDIAQVNRHWHFAFDAWGYERREPAPSRAH